MTSTASSRKGSSPCSHVQSRIISTWRRPLTSKSSAASTHLKEGQSAGIVKVHFCESEEQSTYKFNGVKTTWQRRENHKASLLFHYGKASVYVWVFQRHKKPTVHKNTTDITCISWAFWWWRTLPTIKNPLSQNRPPWNSLFKCSIPDLFSPLQPQGKGIRGTSEMQPMFTG